MKFGLIGVIVKTVIKVAPLAIPLLPVVKQAFKKEKEKAARPKV